MNNIFKGKDIEFAYKKDQLVLKGLSLSIGEGQIYGLLGPNGAGKSTLTRVMLGLDDAKSGKIEWFGKKPNKDTNKQIGYVPQDLALIYDLSAYENVLFFGKLYGLKGDELKAQTKYALEFVGLWEERSKTPKNFSGGMKRRLNIACGIVHDPDVIILDEPTVGVDPQSRNHILDSIVALNQRGRTIVYISHYMEEVEKICSHVGIIDKGQLLCEGELSEVIQSYSKQGLIELEMENEGTIYEEKLTQFDVLSLEGHRVTIAIAQKDFTIFKTIQDVFPQEIKSFKYIIPNLEQVFFELTRKKLRD
ncbi:MAG: ABC transporter ATP-binding protein [Streptococcaceae bacterium]|jgi:ABC-2 type transport system ATP-binding protein|nr:ABC transporter ATP-binding protein [Streptococcaceae bacterium]